MAIEGLLLSRPRIGQAWTGTGADWDAAMSRSAQPSPIVQSWGWGKAESQLGRRVLRVQLPSGGMATVVAYGIGPVSYCVAHGGPVPATRETVDELTAWARAQGFARLRIGPEVSPDDLDLPARGFQHRPAEDTGHTLVLTLAPDDHMLASFRPKTRSSVRRSIETGVTVDIGREADVLARLTAMSAARQRIYVPGAHVYQALLDNLSWCRTYVARYQGEPLAAALIGRHDSRAYYMYAGSSPEQRQVMPAYAVQWAAIRTAFAAGCRDYDMWGVPPDGDPAHPMHGLWHFKTGFGGRVERRGGVWDLVLSTWREAVSIRERALRGRLRDVRDRLRGHTK